MWHKVGGKNSLNVLVVSPQSTAEGTRLCTTVRDERLLVVCFRTQFTDAHSGLEVQCFCLQRCGPSARTGRSRMNTFPLENNQDFIKQTQSTGCEDFLLPSNTNSNNRPSRQRQKHSFVFITFIFSGFEFHVCSEAKRGLFSFF